MTFEVRISGRNTYQTTYWLVSAELPDRYRMIGLFAGRYFNQQILVPMIVICDWPKKS